MREALVLGVPCIGAAKVLMGELQAMVDRGCRRDEAHQWRNGADRRHIPNEARRPMLVNSEFRRKPSPIDTRDDPWRRELHHFERNRANAQEPRQRSHQTT